MNIDCRLALAQNYISPKAYKQNDIVMALNGTHIEINHSDADGRMVRADTLTLASRDSSVFATSDELASRAVSIGKPTTSSPRASSSASSNTIRRGCMWTYRPAAAKAGWVSWRMK